MEKPESEKQRRVQEEVKPLPKCGTCKKIFLHCQCEDTELKK